VDFDEGSTLLIGDTSRDVEAGLTGGALVLGVATGKTPSLSCGLLALTPYWLIWPIRCFSRRRFAASCRLRYPQRHDISQSAPNSSRG